MGGLAQHQTYRPATDSVSGRQSRPGSTADQDAAHEAAGAAQADGCLVISRGDEQATIEAGLALDVRRRLVPAADVRRQAKTDLPENGALPPIEVDPDTFTVRIDGAVIEPEPVDELPMTQRYFLF